MVWTLGGDGEPDMRNDARPRGVEQLLCGARSDRPVIGVAARAVETGLFERLVILRAGIAREKCWATAAIARLALRGGWSACGRGESRESREAPQETATWSVRNRHASSRWNYTSYPRECGRRGKNGLDAMERAPRLPRNSRRS